MSGSSFATVLRAGAVQGQRKMLSNDLSTNETKYEHLDRNNFGLVNTNDANKGTKFFAFDHETRTWKDNSYLAQNYRANCINPSLHIESYEKGPDMKNIENEVKKYLSDINKTSGASNVAESELKQSESLNEEDGNNLDFDLNRIWSENDIHCPQVCSAFIIPDSIGQARQMWNNSDTSTEELGDAHNENVWQLDDPTDLLNSPNGKQVATTEEAREIQEFSEILIAEGKEIEPSSIILTSDQPEQVQISQENISSHATVSFDDPEEKQSSDEPLADNIANKVIDPANKEKDDVDFNVFENLSESNLPEPEPEDVQEFESCFESEEQRNAAILSMNPVEKAEEIQDFDSFLKSYEQAHSDSNDLRTLSIEQPESENALESSGSLNSNTKQNKYGQDLDIGTSIYSNWILGQPYEIQVLQDYVDSSKHTVDTEDPLHLISSGYSSSADLYSANNVPMENMQGTEGSDNLLLSRSNVFVRRPSDTESLGMWQLEQTQQGTIEEFKSDYNTARDDQIGIVFGDAYPESISSENIDGGSPGIGFRHVPILNMNSDDSILQTARIADDQSKSGHNYESLIQHSNSATSVTRDQQQSFICQQNTLIGLESQELMESEKQMSIHNSNQNRTEQLPMETYNFNQIQETGPAINDQQTEKSYLDPDHHVDISQIPSASADGQEVHEAEALQAIETNSANQLEINEDADVLQVIELNSADIIEVNQANSADSKQETHDENSNSNQEVLVIEAGHEQNPTAALTDNLIPAASIREIDSARSLNHVSSRSLDNASFDSNETELSDLSGSDEDSDSEDDGSEIENDHESDADSPGSIPKSKGNKNYFESESNESGSGSIKQPVSKLALTSKKPAVLHVSSSESPSSSSESDSSSSSSSSSSGSSSSSSSFFKSKKFVSSPPLPRRYPIVPKKRPSSKKHRDSKNISVSQNSKGAVLKADHQNFGDFYVLGSEKAESPLPPADNSNFLLIVIGIFSLLLMVLLVLKKFIFASSVTSVSHPN
jgi:hypothetical protein